MTLAILALTAGIEIALAACWARRWVREVRWMALGFVEALGKGAA